MFVFLSTFETTVVNDVEPVVFNASSPLSNRVVFISIDGLGQRILWNSPQKHIPFLMWVNSFLSYTLTLDIFTFFVRFSRNITKSGGEYGFVEAEAPTETRPRHVAMLAGFNEDIANIKSGKNSKTLAFTPLFLQFKHAF